MNAAPDRSSLKHRMELERRRAIVAQLGGDSPTAYMRRTIDRLFADTWSVEFYFRRWAIVQFNFRRHAKALHHWRKAWRLRNTGMSFKEIGQRLGCSRARAREMDGQYQKIINKELNLRSPHRRPKHSLLNPDLLPEATQRDVWHTATVWDLLDAK